MAGARWTIYWNEYSSDTYLYGSEIAFHKKDDVEYKNLLMPPGTVIKQWYSKTNFQMQKIEPALPMIDGESAYRIHINIDMPFTFTGILYFPSFDKNKPIFEHKNISLYCNRVFVTDNVEGILERTDI